jgi:hypothetical protein
MKVSEKGTVSLVPSAVKEEFYAGKYAAKREDMSGKNYRDAFLPESHLMRSVTDLTEIDRIKRLITELYRDRVWLHRNPDD